METDFTPEHNDTTIDIITACMISFSFFFIKKEEKLRIPCEKNMKFQKCLNNLKIDKNKCPK
jgi:hypothetical protein